MNPKGERRCWGVYRELAHSPGRETDDAEILRAVARELEARDFEVELKSPDELPDSDDASGVPPFLFVMCERPEVVRRLAAWERQGISVVNRPEAIRNTDRERTIARFASERVPFPKSELVSTAAGSGGGIAFPCWVKRGDVHATQGGDVSFVTSSEDLEATLARLAERGIGNAVLQKHVPGDLIKFYGVKGGGETETGLSWFHGFYHRDQALARHPFDPRELEAEASRAAGALGLDVFGGDAIATPKGRIVLIDLNAWPSFALYRSVAASSIASLLAARLAAKTGVLR